jgi:hypothetical protein
MAMVQPADLREWHDLSHAWRLDETRLRAVRLQRQVSSALVIVGETGLQNASKMPWSVLKISGLPYQPSASSRAVTQNSGSSVLDNRQLKILRDHQSMTTNR